MKMFIPEIGFEFTLSKEWNFKLILEHRNKKLIQYLYPNHICDTFTFYNYIVKELGFNGNCLRTEKIRELMKDGNSRAIWENNPTEWIAEENLEPATFPVGTILKVDRIYIRKGAGMSEYSSLSFYATLPGQKKKFRFFAKLNDVNTIEFND